jgi:outer membrane protein
MKKLLAFTVLIAVSLTTMAQDQKIGFYESEVILEQIPEYEGIEQQLDVLSEQWQEEITQMEVEIRELEEDYEAKEVLYTEEIRGQRQQEIAQKKQDKDRFIAQKFGPEGEYFTRQRELLEPIQRQVFSAVSAIAERQNYDFVFDRTGDIYMVFANSEYNLNDDILRELGVDVENQ